MRNQVRREPYWKPRPQSRLTQLVKSRESWHFGSVPRSVGLGRGCQTRPGTRTRNSVSGMAHILGFWVRPSTPLSPLPPRCRSWGWLHTWRWIMRGMPVWSCRGPLQQSLAWGKGRWLPRGKDIKVLAKLETVRERNKTPAILVWEGGQQSPSSQTG